MQASAIAAQDTGAQEAYWRFHDAVAQAQVSAWLAGRHRIIVDMSGPASLAAMLAGNAGHSVVRVAEPGAAAAAGRPGRPQAGPPVADAPGHGGREAPLSGGQGGREAPLYMAKQQPGKPSEAGRIGVVAADGGGLEFLADGCADGVIAEDRTLSRRLAAETVVSEIWRVLRPGGQVLASVDSLTRGMGVLAEQHHWPHLVDLPHADVVLIPWPDGTITRCYGTQQLRELFTGSGFEVDWIRPRTVLSASAVSYLLARDPGRFARLVQAELHASADDSVGAQLLISARKR